MSALTAGYPRPSRSAPSREAAETSGPSFSFDVDTLRQYLVSILPPLLNAQISSLEQSLFSPSPHPSASPPRPRPPELDGAGDAEPSSLGEQSGWYTIAANFAREPSIPVIYINQLRQKASDTDIVQSTY